MDVASSYDDVAEEYASLFLKDLDRNSYARGWLDRFAAIAGDHDGPVADLGCGPGLVCDYLSQRGLATVGYDVSPGQIAQARLAFPDLEFDVGDFGAVAHPDSSLGGIVSRYSIIHTDPSHLDPILSEWMRVLEPGGPVLITFFGSLTAEAHGTPFGHTVATAYELFPATIAQQLHDVGFVDCETDTRPPPKEGRPFSQGTVFGHTPS